MEWADVTLFMMILARMTGFVLFNPLFGRQSIPGLVKSGLILLLSVTVFPMTDYRPEIPEMMLALGAHLLLEMALGYLLGLVMNIFFYIPLLGGETIDTQMGMSMGKTYDPASQSSVSVSATLFNVLMMLLFFAANGHHTLLRIMLCSGRVVPFGQVAFGPELYAAVVELFVECTLMAVKLCMPILAAELLGQMGMGILMKVIPQINIFVINIDLKVIIGLALELLLIAPFSEYLLKVEFDMLQALQRLLQIIGTS